MLDLPDGNQPRAANGRPSLPALCGPDGPIPKAPRRVVHAAEEGKENQPPSGTSKSKRGTAKVSQRRFWCFTSCDTETEQKFLQTIEGGLDALGGDVRYIVFQKERASTGKIHYQGYVEFKKSYRFNRVRALIAGNAHFEARRGTATEAIAYCKKEDTRIEGPWEFGQASKGPGTRTDLGSFRDAIRDGARRRDLFDSQPVMMAKFPKFYEAYRMTLQPEGWRSVECVLLIGDTGTGKTRWVYDNWKGFWRLPMITTGLWFDTYDGHTHALMDDFAGAASKVSLVSLLQILDGYFIKVPIKHGFTWWGPTHIAVTTNLEPRSWYQWNKREHQYMALARRFTKIMQFTVEDGIIMYTSEEYFHADDIVE